MKCVCGHDHNDHAPELTSDEPCGLSVCLCQRFRPYGHEPAPDRPRAKADPAVWPKHAYGSFGLFLETETPEQQLRRLWSESCPASDPSQPFSGHALFKVHTHRFRDWFRKRRWWRCFECGMAEELHPDAQ